MEDPHLMAMQGKTQPNQEEGDNYVQSEDEDEGNI